MDDIPPSPDAQAEERRFTLSVWPQTPTMPWRALVRTTELAPAIRFDRPTDLVLYLTELLPGAGGHPPGLR